MAEPKAGFGLEISQDHKCKVSKGEDLRQIGEVEPSGTKGLEKRSKVEDRLQRAESKDQVRGGEQDVTLCFVQF